VPGSYIYSRDAFLTDGSRANKKSVVEIIRGGPRPWVREGAGSGIAQVRGARRRSRVLRRGMSRSRTFATGVDCFMGYGDEVVRDMGGL